MRRERGQPRDHTEELAGDADCSALNGKIGDHRRRAPIRFGAFLTSVPGSHRGRETEVPKGSEEVSCGACRPSADDMAHVFARAWPRITGVIKVVYPIRFEP